MMEIWSHLSAYPGSDGTPRVFSSQPRINHLGVKVFRPLAVVSVGAEVQVERGLRLGCQESGKTKKVPLCPIPLKSLSKSGFCLFLSPSSEIDAALFSLARRSNPKTDVRGVGGSRGFTGGLNLCCFHGIRCKHQSDEWGLTHSILANEPTLANWFGLQHITVLHYDSVAGLQEILRCFLVDMGEYLPVYLDEERVGESAKGFRSCKGMHLTHSTVQKTSLTLYELINGVGLGDVLYAPG